MRPGFTPIDGYRATAEAVILNGLILRLYAVDHAPALGDTLESYRELEVLGYGPVHLSSSLDHWTFAVDDSKTGAVLATYRDEVLWRFGMYGPTVFGYLVTLGGRVLGVQPFDKKFTIENRGDSLALTPAIRFGPESTRRVEERR